LDFGGTLGNIQLLQGDCLEVMPTLPMVDAIITDIPYGTTACAWDEIIPFVPMWEQVKRVLKPRGVFVTTASQPFTTRLIMSNFEWFKYEWIWEKTCSSNYVHAKNRPIINHENILIFSEGVVNHESLSPNTRITYNPQMEVGEIYKKTVKSLGQKELHKASPANRAFVGTTYGSNKRYPKTVIRFSNPHGEETEHTSEKPVALYSYLIQTYTNPGDTVLDICMGSGTTIVAAIQTGRNAIGIELDESYFKIAERRVHDAQQQMPLFVESVPSQPMSINLQPALEAANA
jgi:site-specific DNA-methyltransferase (adenine-specific)